MKFFVTLFLVFFLANFESKAAVGCLSSNTTYTYINPNGYYYSGAVGYYHRYESDRRLTSNTFCTSPVVPSTACYINATRYGYSSSPGTLVNYVTTNNCNVPLDGYEWVLLSTIGLFSVLLIRNKYSAI